MTQGQVNSEMVQFMVRLRRIDKMGLTQRDVLLLWFIREHPGVEGQEMTQKLGFASRSQIATNIRRIIRKGLVEDRRIKQERAIPNILHLLPEGEKFWSELHG